MDRRVKERLVGAFILVVLVVLIVPELLSGPKQALVPAAASTTSPADSHDVTVDLTTSKATPTADEPAASAASPASTADAVEGGSATSTVDGVAESTAENEAAPAAPPSIVTLQAQTPPKAHAVENDEPTPKSSTHAARPVVAPVQAAEAIHHNWWVQLGSFSSRANAEKLQRNLKAKGFTAAVSQSGAGKTTRYRVRVGPAADRAGAEKLIPRLRKEGHAATVVGP